jgi:heme exporter protein B
MTRWAIKFWWLLHKDLITEYRSRQIWPSMLLLGSVVVLAFSIQLQTLVDRERAAGGLLWLAIFFSSTVAVDRSFAAERDDGCLDGLMSYPVPAGMLYLQKLAGNMLAMICLEFLLVPLFVVLTGVPLLAHPWRLAAVLALATRACRPSGHSSEH